MPEPAVVTVTVQAEPTSQPAVAEPDQLTDDQLTKPVEPRFERFTVLVQGDYGDNVRTLQELLSWRGIRTLDDADFGPATERSVRQWQAQNGLSITGVVDDTTWESLLPRLSTGSSGEGVKILQRTLTDWGLYGLKIDGDFGPKTAEAVKDFQEWRGIVADGVVGPQTWASLLS